MIWPPPAPGPNTYAVCLRVRTRTGEMSPLPSGAVLLATETGQTAPRWHHNPNYGAGFWSWIVTENPTGPLRLRIGFPADGPAKGFVMWIDPARGVPVRDATWRGHPFPYAPGKTVIVELRHPEDFWGVAAIAFEPAAPDAHAWAGQVPLAFGAGTGVPAGLADTHHASVWPGSYPLSIRHPRYALPANTPPLSVNSSAVYRRVALQALAQPQPPSVPPTEPPTAPPVTPPAQKFSIVTTSALVLPNEFLDLRTNAPDAHAAQVQWQSSHPQVLVLERAARFRGVAPGVARITARYKDQSAILDVLVRPAADRAVRKPLDPGNIVVDPWAGAMAKGELMLRPKEGISAADFKACLAEHGLIEIGHIPATGSYQLAFDPSRVTTRALVEKLRQDRRIESVVPNALFARSHFWNPVFPAEIQPPPGDWPYWHLYKIELFAAYGVLHRYTRPTQSIIFVDSGVEVLPNGTPSQDLANRIDLANSVSVTSWWNTTGLSALKAIDPKRHGNRSATVALGLWDGYRSAGIERGHVVMIKAEDVSDPKKGATQAELESAFAAAAARVRQHSRVVCIIHDLETEDWLGYNYAFKPYFRQLLGKEKNALVVIAAGNHGKPLSNHAISTIKTVLGDVSGPGAVIIVGGTAVGTTLGIETRWGMTSGGGSPFDPASQIDLCAPAQAIHTPGANDVFAPESGTSLSAPIVAACASIVSSLLDPATPAQTIKQILVESADPVFEIGPQPPYPVPRLHTRKSERIGSRVNLWQAVLNTLNRVAPKELWFGLRVTTDRSNMELVLVDGKNAEHPLQVIKNDPASTAGARVSLDAAHPRPLFLLGRSPGGPKQKPFFKHTLPADPAGIQRLSPHYVITRTCFTTGKVALARETPNGLGSDEAMFRIDNLGADAGLDAEMLTPEAARPYDKSRRAWMRLFDGDAFAMRATVVRGPANLKLTFFDEVGTTAWPLSQYEGSDPYLMVRFNTNNQGKFRLRAAFAFGSNEDADIKMEVWSLHNELVRAELKVTVKADSRWFKFEPLDGSPIKSKGAWCWHRWRVTYVGPALTENNAAKLTVSAQFDNPAWSRATYSLDTSKYWVPNSQGTLMAMALSPGENSMLHAKLQVRCDREPYVVYPLETKFEGAAIAISIAANPNYRDHVVPVDARFANSIFNFQIENRSPMPVLLLKDFPGASLSTSENPITGGVPNYPVTVAPEKMADLDLAWAQGRFVLGAQRSVSTKIRLYYLRKYTNQGRSGRRTVFVRVGDPEPPPGMPFGPPSVPSNVVELHTGLREPPEG